MNILGALKQRVSDAIDRRREYIESIGERIMANPELGFKEEKTANLVSETMASFGIAPETGLAVTGVKGVLKGGKPGPTVAVIGELDSLLVSDHPDADPDTGAAHSCGHNAQIAGLMGAMMGLVDSGAFKELSGNIVFFAVPAEEYCEIEYRLELKNKGKLHFLGGKQELIYQGLFDDIDIAMMIHTHPDQNTTKACVCNSCNAFLVKKVRFEGVSTHSGFSPEKGVNALSAAQIALAAINAQRETFSDKDSVRVSPIITKGGELLNVMPADVHLESYVRAKNIDALRDADMKVERALRAGAMAVGAKVEIETLPGYMPMKEDPNLRTLFVNNVKTLFGENEITEVDHYAGSTDMGDLSSLIPCIHPLISGASGIPHGKDFKIVNKYLGYVAPAKVLALMVVDLLHDDARKAREVIRQHQPVMTKAEYISFQDSMNRTEFYDGVTGTTMECGIELESS